MNWLTLIRFCIIAFFVSFNSLGFYAQLISPDIECTQVDAAGGTTINWTSVSDPNGDFVAYHLFASNGGPFIEIAALFDPTISSFVDLANDASAFDMCYYLVVEYSTSAGNVMAPPSTTMCNVTLSLSTSASNPGMLEISWSGQNAINGYLLMWDDPFTNWSNSVTLPSTENNYLLEIATCGDLLSFLIFSNQTTCPSISPVEEGFFYDQTPPLVPEITSVSVSNGHPLVNWNVSASEDVAGYILYGCNSAGEFIVDTIFGGNVTSYADLSIQSANQSACYTLAAFDDCPSGNPPSPNTSEASASCNCSVLLAPLQQTFCTDNISLSWTPYQGWADGVAAYIIYHAEGNGLYSIVDTVDGGSLQYVHELQGFLDLNHSYYVLAIGNNGRFSISNVRNITLNYPSPPAEFYISNVDVELDSSISVHCFVETTATVHQVILQQYDDFFEEWSNIQYLDNGVSNIVFSVSGLVPAYFSYRFRFALVNECGDTTAYSNVGKTILLDGLLNDERDENSLKWSGYENWPSDVYEYQLYRKLGKNGFYSKLLTLNGLSQYHNDDVDSLFQEDGLFYYRIKAVGHLGDLAVDTAFEAWSNEIVMLQTPKVYIPNCIVINGVNNTFGPVVSFSPLTGFEMIVYSKWGDVLFQTDDYAVRWDGRDEGEDFVPQGVYVYYIRCANGADELFSKKGTVTVLYGE